MRLTLLCAGLLAGAFALPATASALPRPVPAAETAGDHRGDLVLVDDDDDDCRGWRCERDDDEDDDDRDDDRDDD